MLVDNLDHDMPPELESVLRGTLDYIHGIFGYTHQIDKKIHIPVCPWNCVVTDTSRPKRYKENGVMVSQNHHPNMKYFIIISNSGTRMHYKEFRFYANVDGGSVSMFACDGTPIPCLQQYTAGMIALDNF